MSLAIHKPDGVNIKEDVLSKEEVKEEVLFIDQENIPTPVQLQTVRPIRFEVPVDSDVLDAEPRQSTSRAVLAEMVVGNQPLAPEWKFDPFELALRARLSSC